jgi:hypothetical protein
MSRNPQQFTRVGDTFPRPISEATEAEWQRILGQHDLEWWLMGSFDSVQADCVRCGTAVEFQSKTGDCRMEVYALQAAPTDVLWGTLIEACPRCGTKLVLEPPKGIWSVRAVEDDEAPRPR